MLPCYTRRSFRAPDGPGEHRIARAEDAANPADGASRSHAVRDGPAGRAALEIAAGREQRCLPAAANFTLRLL